MRTQRRVKKHNTILFFIDTTSNQKTNNKYDMFTQSSSSEKFTHYHFNQPAGLSAQETD